MKKFIFGFLMMISALAVNAQYNVSGHRFFDNWSIGLDGGVSSNLHDWDTPNGGVAGIQLTKGITPVLSFEFSAQTGFNDNANWNVPHSSTVVDNVTALASTKVNLMNWWCGYKGTPRLFEIQARTGAGFMKDFKNNDEPGVGRQNSGIVKAGLDFDFNVGKLCAWTLSVRPAVVLKTHNGDAWCDNTSQCKRYSHNALGQLTAGVTYHFKTSNGSHGFTTVPPVEVTKIVEKVVEKPVERIVEHRYIDTTVVTKTHVVEFAQNSAELTSRAKETLNNVDTNCTVVVKGYASPEGSKAYNLELSQKRADVVKEYFEKRGVKVAKATGYGVVDTDSQRIVYIEVE